jgi:hypothetical protein
MGVLPLKSDGNRRGAARRAIRCQVMSITSEEFSIVATIWPVEVIDL